MNAFDQKLLTHGLTHKDLKKRIAEWKKKGIPHARFYRVNKIYALNEIIRKSEIRG